MSKIVYNACFGGFSLSLRAIARIAELEGRKAYFYKSEGFTGDYELIDKPVEQIEDELFIAAFDVPNINEILPPYNAEDWHSFSDEEKNRRNNLYNQHSLGNRDVDRTNPHLIQAVEELRDAASGRCAHLVVKELLTGTKYRITEYDGYEGIETPDDIAWEVMP